MPDSAWNERSFWYEMMNHALSRITGPEICEAVWYDCRLLSNRVGAIWKPSADRRSSSRGAKFPFV